MKWNIPIESLSLGGFALRILKILLDIRLMATRTTLERWLVVI